MKKSKVIACGLAVVLAVALCRSAAWSAPVPAKVPAGAPAKTSSEVPAKAAVGTPTKAPAPVPAQVSVSPAKAPAGTPGKTPAPAPAKAAAGAPLKAPAPVPETTASLESYRYNPAGKPDPFVPFIEKELMLQKRAEKKTSSSIFPLQNANVDQFKLVGIAGNERRRVAVVEDERGKFYTLNEGTLIGRNHGKVKSILADRVVVEEKIGMEAGGARINRITIKLHKEDNEGKP